MGAEHGVDQMREGHLSVHDAHDVIVVRSSSLRRAKTEDDGFMPVVNAVLAGDVNKLQAELQRVQELSLNPVGVLLAFERRTAQLAQLSA